MPWLTFGTVDRITQRGFKYVFRPHANDTLKAQDAGRRASWRSRKKAGPIKTAVIMSARTPSGANRSPKSRRTSSRRPASKIKLVEHYPYAAPDLTSMVVKAGALRPDLVLANSYLGDALLITRLMGEQELRPIVYAAGGGGHLQPDFVKGAGELAEGIICATMWDPAVGKQGAVDQGDQ